MTDRYAVFGNPIAHSKSPQIHSLFARQTAERLSYDAECIEVEQFGDAVQRFFASGGKGLNITVPFKLEAHQLAAQLTERAQRAGAVNTLALDDDGTVIGDNTDGVGMVRDIVHNHVWPIAGQRVLILGAGGAARGVMAPLLAEQPQSLVIANRTVEKALALANEFADLAVNDGVTGVGYEVLAGQQFDLVINATSASLAGDLPPLPDDLLSSTACCYDMMYGAEPTVFLQWAEAQGAVASADGLGMLVEQAAESFLLWRGVRPDTAPVIEAVRESLLAV